MHAGQHVISDGPFKNESNNLNTGVCWREYISKDLRRNVIHWHGNCYEDADKFAQLETATPGREIASVYLVNHLLSTVRARVSTC